MKLFKLKKIKNIEGNENTTEQKKKLSKTTLTEKIKGMKTLNWFKISVIANIVIIALAVFGFSGMAIIHQSDTNPNFCASCHIMQNNVSSYLTSNHMDNVHKQAGVECKDCHDYPVPAEIRSGINFLIGNYAVNQDGNILKQKYSDDMCFECHISYSFIADSTSFLERNPHENHNGQLHCYTCHISHGNQIDYCSGCHENGGQQMIEDDSAREVTAQ